MIGRLKRLDFVIFLMFTYFFGCKCGGICPSEWSHHGTSCYLLVQTNMKMSDAQNHCMNLHSSLAEVTSDSEHQFLKALCENDILMSYYIGGTDDKEEGKWLWTGSGNSFNYTKWGHGEPDAGRLGNCVQMDTVFEYAWADRPCLFKDAFICEMEQLTPDETANTNTEPSPGQGTVLITNISQDTTGMLTPDETANTNTEPSPGQGTIVTTNISQDTTGMLTPVETANTNTELSPGQGTVLTTNISQDTTTGMNTPGSRQYITPIPVSTTPAELLPDQETVLTTNVASLPTEIPIPIASQQITSLKVPATTYEPWIESETALTTNAAISQQTIPAQLSATTTESLPEQGTVLTTNAALEETTAEMLIPTSSQHSIPVQASEDHVTSALQTTPVQQNSLPYSITYKTTNLEMTSVKTVRSFPCAANRMFKSPRCCFKNETMEEIKRLILILRQLLTITKTDTSKHKRSLISAPDHRPSAVAIGYCGIIFFIFVGLVIILFDVLKLVRYFGQGCGNR